MTPKAKAEKLSNIEIIEAIKALTELYKLVKPEAGAGLGADVKAKLTKYIALL